MWPIEDEKKEDDTNYDLALLHCEKKKLYVWPNKVEKQIFSF